MDPWLFVMTRSLGMNVGMTTARTQRGLSAKSKIIIVTLTIALFRRQNDFKTTVNLTVNCYGKARACRLYQDTMEMPKKYSFRLRLGVNTM